MIRLALRSVRARWGRVVLTALAIVASTAFLSGTFIFRDTVQRTFNALFADVAGEERLGVVARAALGDGGAPRLGHLLPGRIGPDQGPGTDRVAEVGDRDVRPEPARPLAGHGVRDAAPGGGGVGD